METNLSINEMKKLVHGVIDEELGKFNLKSNVFPMTYIEFYRDYVLGNKFRLVDYISYPFTSDGFEEKINNNNNIILFLKRNFDDIELMFFNLVFACYHEARHVEQSTFSEYSYERFFCAIEQYIVSNGNKFEYDLAHDKYSFEIGANLYGVYKASEYLIKNYPELYKKIKIYIDEVEKIYIADYLTYDAVDTIERFIQVSKKMFKLSEVAKRGNGDEYEDVEVSPVWDIFLDDNDCFFSVSQIISNDNFKKLDSRIISAMFSCKSFLDSLDMDNLSLLELEVVSNALEYTNTVYQNQTKLLESTSKKESVEFLNRLSVIKLMNFSINDDVKRENMRNIPYYLNKTKRLIKQKNDGRTSSSL